MDWLELKGPAIKTLMFFSAMVDAKKNEGMTLSRTLRRMYDQRLTAAYKRIWSPGLFELNSNTNSHQSLKLHFKLRVHISLKDQMLEFLPLAKNMPLFKLFFGIL